MSGLIAVDVGGTTIKGALIDPDGVVVDRSVHPTGYRVRVSCGDPGPARRRSGRRPGMASAVAALVRGIATIALVLQPERVVLGAALFAARAAGLDVLLSH